MRTNDSTNGARQSRNPGVRGFGGASTVPGNQGFVLVAALMFLVILSIIGVSASSTMTVEQLISRNDRLTQEAFYGADGGIEAGIEMVEQNVLCADGFETGGETTLQIHNIEVLDPLFWKQPVPDDDELSNYPGDADGFRDMVIPPRDALGNDQTEHTNLSVFGYVRYPNGTGLAIASGGEGLGNSAVSGAYYYFDIYSQKIGGNSNTSIHNQRWVHRLDTMGECEYGF